MSLALSVMEIWRSPKILKVGHVTQTTPLLTQVYIFCLAALRIVLRAKFRVFSFVRYGDMDGVPKFTK